MYTTIRDFVLFLALWERVYCSTFIHVSRNSLCMKIRDVVVVFSGWIIKDELGLWTQQHIDCFILLKSYNSKYLWLRSQCSCKSDKNYDSAVSHCNKWRMKYQIPWVHVNGIDHHVDCYTNITSESYWRWLISTDTPILPCEICT